MNQSDPKTALVLSGGASLGAVQVGMVRALYERGIGPDLIVGASVGAINGAFLASRPATTRTVDELATIWRRIARWQVFPLSPVSSTVDMRMPELVGVAEVDRSDRAHLASADADRPPTPRDVHGHRPRAAIAA